MTTFFPSMMLIAITYATTFVKPVYFKALAVNVTIMLVITTLFISVMNKLPPTSYIKWIECWLIFAQLVPLTQIVLLTIIERSREFKEEEKTEEENDNNEECGESIPHDEIEPVLVHIGRRIVTVRVITDILFLSSKIFPCLVHVQVTPKDWNVELEMDRKEIHEEEEQKKVEEKKREILRTGMNLGNIGKLMLL